LTLESLKKHNFSILGDDMPIYLKEGKAGAAKDKSMGNLFEVGKWCPYHLVLTTSYVYVVDSATGI